MATGSGTAGSELGSDWLSAEELQALDRVWKLFQEHGPQALELARSALVQLTGLMGPSPTESPADALIRLNASVADAAVVDVRAWARQISGWGAQLAHEQVRLRDVFDIVEAVRRQLVHWIVERHASEASALEQTLFALQRLCDRTIETIAEAALTDRNLRISEQRRSTDDALLWLKRLSESGLLGILVCDVHGGIKDANETFAQMVNYTREELASGQVGWDAITPPEWVAQDIDAVAQLAAHGRTKPWEKEYFRRDGSRVPVLVGVATLSGDDVVAFTLEISERKQAEELRARSLELETENRRVQEASRLKSEFLANMSHELRTPLNSVIGFADILYEGEVPAGSPEGREYLGDILKSGRHLLQLINDVLDLAKVESGKMEFRAEHVELPRVVGEVLDVLRSLAGASQISVTCELEPNAHELVVDPARLKQVLYNYLSNAFKFTPPGGHVIVRAHGSDTEHVTIEVEDDGAGIAPADLSRLFVEFQQLDNGSTKKHAGTGLGLALTRRIVEAQGGRVGVRSELGRGSTFWAILPRQAHPVTSDECVRVIEHGRSAALVLVVEDDRDDQRLISATLNGAGYNVEIAETGTQAAKACGERLFDAVTLDLLLPDRSGLQVLRELRTSGLNRDTPVIVLSVVAEQQVIHGFAVSDYLAKPVDSANILGSLQRAGVLPARAGTILVVDDDPSSLKLMSTTLRKLGYTPDCQSDAALALSRAPSQHHSAVILDLLMPGMDGFEFLLRFRAQPSSYDVPVIVWTTKDLTADDQRLLKRQAQAVFEKGGGRPMLLVEELNNLLRSHSAPRAEAP